MTIKHLLDHRARLPRLGRIRLGVKKVAASGKEYPAEVSYFVIPDELKAVLGHGAVREVCEWIIRWN